MNLLLYLDQYWNWANTTPQKYAEQQDSDDEYMFPLWNEMMTCAKETIMNDVTITTQTKEILLVLALDHEREELLDYLSDYATDHNIGLLAAQSLVLNQPHAKWQIAELIARRKLFYCKWVLLELCTDQNEYVRRRANNALLMLPT